MLETLRSPLSLLSDSCKWVDFGCERECSRPLCLRGESRALLPLGVRERERVTLRLKIKKKEEPFH